MRASFVGKPEPVIEAPPAPHEWKTVTIGRTTLVLDHLLYWVYEDLGIQEGTEHQRLTVFLNVPVGDTLVQLEFGGAEARYGIEALDRILG